MKKFQKDEYPKRINQKLIKELIKQEKVKFGGYITLGMDTPENTKYNEILISKNRKKYYIAKH